MRTAYGLGTDGIVGAEILLISEDGMSTQSEDKEMSSYNDCKPISRINMGIWLVELSHIPLCEEFEPEAHCKEIAFRFA